MRIDDVMPGESLPELRLTVEPGPMQIMTLLTEDPNPIHFDTNAVERLGMGNRLINQGVLNLAYPINVLLAMVDGDPARVAWIRVRFRGNVRAGDEVVAGGRVGELSPAGHVREVAIWLDIANGERVLEGQAGLRVGRQPS